MAGIYFVSMYIPIAGLVAQLLLGLFLAAYFFTIIQSSAGGEKRQPRLPDATDMWDDLVRPVFWMLAAFVWLAGSGYSLTARAAGASSIGGFVAFITLVYLSWVIAHAIGITHWVYRERLGWFRST